MDGCLFQHAIKSTNDILMCIYKYCMDGCLFQHAICKLKVQMTLMCVFINPAWMDVYFKI